MLDKINEAISSAIPKNLGSDVKNNVEAVVRSGLEKMDLVTREQFDVQQKILERTQERVKSLEERIAKLEGSDTQ